MKECPYCGKEYPDDAEVCAIDRNPLVPAVSGSDGLTNSPSSAKPAKACPACGALDGYKPAVELRSSFSWFIFLAGGLFAVLFHNAGRTRRVQCNHCGALFNIRTPLSKVSLVILWLLVAPTIIGLVFLLFYALYAFFARGG